LGYAFSHFVDIESIVNFILNYASFFSTKSGNGIVKYVFALPFCRFINY
jgi:hypothetical protein